MLVLPLFNVKALNFEVLIQWLYSEGKKYEAFFIPPRYLKSISYHHPSFSPTSSNLHNLPLPTSKHFSGPSNIFLEAFMSPDLT